MAGSDALTVDEYIANLPPQRQASIRAVRDAVRRNLPAGYEEGMQFGMIAWYVPLEHFPDTYNGRPLGLAALASQKNYMSLYLNSVYGDRETEAWFKERFAESGKQLDMGKSCVRFKSADDLPLDVIGAAIARVDIDQFVDQYRESRGSSRKTRGANR